MPDYDFLSLASQDFEALVRDLLQEEMGHHIESFGPGKDGGIDLRFASGNNKIIVQAKRYSEASKYLFANSIVSDYDKIKALNPSRYIIATSLNLTPQAKDNIVSKLTGLPISSSDILCRSDLNNLIGKHPHVEQRHFKLWLQSSAILSRILNNATYEKSLGEIDNIKDKVRLFVDTPATSKGQQILSSHHCLIISGPPGVGKTTLSRMLILIHLSQDWELVVVDEPNEALAVFSESRNQLFVFDDFLGRTRLSQEYLRQIDEPLVRLMDKVRRSKSSRFIMTTRSYILAQAQIASDRIDHPDINIANMVLDVETYTRDVKAQILYNHVLFSELNVEHKQAFVTNRLYKRIVDHKNYMPRLIETLTNRNFVDGLGGADYTKTILSTMDKPTLIWEKAYNHHLSPQAKVLLSAIFFGEGAASLSIVQERYSSLYHWIIKDGTRANFRSFENALRELDGSFVTFSKLEIGTYELERIDFANPSVSDFLEDEFSKTDAAHHLLEHFSFASQFKSAWEFVNRNPRCKPNAAELKQLLETGCAKIADLPLLITDNPFGGVDIALLDIMNLIFSMSDVIGSGLVDKITSRIATRLRDENATSTHAALAFLQTLPKSWSGSKTGLSEVTKLLEEMILDQVKNEPESLSISDVHGVQERIGSEEIHDDIAQALKEITANLEAEMEEITTETELSDFKDLIIPLLDQYGIDNESVLDAIDEKEINLRQDDYEPDYPEYSTSTLTSVVDTDRQMDSLFSSLISDS